MLSLIFNKSCYHQYFHYYEYHSHYRTHNINGRKKNTCYVFLSHIQKAGSKIDNWFTLNIGLETEQIDNKLNIIFIHSFNKY
jgi:hypothetical protein